MKIRSIFSLCLAFFFISKVAYAFFIPPVTGPPPKFVYRIEFLGPDRIFQEGFRIWGDDNNYFRHLTGVTTKKYETAFTSTTSDIKAAQRIADERFEHSQYFYKNPKVDRIWIYQIRTSKKFYDTQATLFYDIERLKVMYDDADSKEEEKKIVRMIRNRIDSWNHYKYEKEWFTISRYLKPSQIIAAYPVMREGNKAVFEPSKVVYNPDYRDTKELPSAPYAFIGPLEPLTPVNKSSHKESHYNLAKGYVYVYKSLQVRWSFPPDLCETEDNQSLLSCSNLIPKPARTLAAKNALPWNGALLNRSNDKK